jgi:hypothetical protein
MKTVACPATGLFGAFCRPTALGDRRGVVLHRAVEHQVRGSGAASSVASRTFSTSSPAPEVPVL